MEINSFIEAMPEKRMQLETNREVEASKGKLNSVASDFGKDLKSALDNHLRSKLDELIGLIEAQGKLLVQAPIYENLIKYKGLVTTFMQETTKNLYQIKEAMVTKGIARQVGQKRVYLTIEEVNKNLAALTEEVLKSQANPIAITARLETIQGLLIDLYS